MAKSHLLRNIVIGLVIVIGVRQYKLYQGLSFGLSKIVVGGSLSSPQLLITLSLDNPTGVSATLASIQGEIYANGTYIARVAYNTLQEIAPYNRTFITLNIIPAMSSVVITALSYAFSGAKGVLFNFKGDAVVNSIPVPLNMDYSFGNT